MQALLRARRCRVAVAFAVVSWAALTGASTIPSTAASQSTGIDPMLLEHVALLYQFPQMALADSQVSAGPHFTGLPLESGLFATDGAGFGVLVRGRSLAVFALTQPSYVPTRGDRYSVDESGQVVQAGLGMRAGAVRFGAALRGTRVRGQSGTEDQTPRQSQDSSSEEVLDYLEAGFGCGVDFGPTRVDLEVEVPHRTAKVGGLRVTSSDTLGARLQTDSRQAWNLVGRVSRPLGGSTHLVAAASYEHGALEWVGQVYTANTTRDTSLTQGLEGWSGAASVATTTRYLDVVAVSAVFSRRQFAAGSFDRYEGFVRANRDVENGALAFSVARQVWRSVTLYAHVQATYYRTKFESAGARSNGSPYFERRSNEYLSGRFGWGAAYSYKRCRFFGALQDPPSLSSPLARLDLQVGF